jgi:hypothetical protein
MKQAALAPVHTAKRPSISYRWVVVLLLLAVGVSILLVYAENRVYNPTTPYDSGSGDHVHAFALDPMNAQHFYLGTHYGFFRTRDGGRSWTRLNGHNGLTNTLVATSITMSPLDARTLYVTGYLLDSGNSAGVFVTRDDGDHWQQIITGGKGQLPDPRVLFLAAGWQQPGEIYAYSLDSGLYRSIDSGQHWASASSPFSEQVTAFVPMLDCQGNPQVIAGTGCQEHLLLGTTQGLYDGVTRSDATVSFAAIQGIDGYIYAIALHRSEPVRITVSTTQGMFQSTAPADTYTQISSTANGAPTLSSVACIDSDPEALIGVTVQNIVVLSHDGGHTWDARGNTQLTRGLSQLQTGLRSATGSNSPQWAGGQNTFLTLAQSATQGDPAVYVAISFPVQIFRTADDGQQWVDLSRAAAK